MAQGGWSWGTTEAPAPIKEYGWDGSDIGAGDTSTSWKIVGTLNSARYNSAGGDLQMQIGDEFVSGVMDKGVPSENKFLEIDISSSGTELIKLEWRGHATTVFNQDAGSPAWEDYPAGGANKNWRYMQVKAKCIEKIEMGGEGITIGGEPVGM